MKTSRLLRQGLLLEYLTLGWNVVGTGVVIWSGLQASSVALIGFGLDSLLEIGASTVAIWQLTGVNQKREQQSLRLMGTAFFILATCVLMQSATTLLAQAYPVNLILALGG